MSQYRGANMPVATFDTESRCHDALLLDLVLLGVFSALIQDSMMASLACAAQTCQAWNEVATKLLWREVEISALIRLVELYGVRKISCQTCHSMIN